MEDLSARVTLIKVKTEKLIGKYNQLEEQNKKLSEKVEKLEKELTEKEQQILEMDSKIKVLKISGSVDEESTKDVKLKINELVREIDKCIAQINK